MNKLPFLEATHMSESNTRQTNERRKKSIEQTWIKREQRIRVKRCSLNSALAQPIFAQNVRYMNKWWIQDDENQTGVGFVFFFSFVRSFGSFEHIFICARDNKVALAKVMAIDRKWIDVILPVGECWCLSFVLFDFITIYSRFMPAIK